MGAPLKTCLKTGRNRTACAVLASGVVISLTALTGGVAPAFAKPDTEPVAPTTTVAPERTVEATQAPAEKPAEKPTEKPTVVDVPSTVAPPAVTAAPTVQETVDEPPQTRAPEPATTVEAPSATRAAEAAPSPAPAVTSVPEAPPTTTATSAAPAAPVTSTPTSATETTPQTVATQSPAAETSPTSEPSTAAETTTAAETSAATTSASSTTLAAEQAIKKVEPRTLEAPDEDVQIAKTAKVVEEKPVEAPKQEIDDISRLIVLPNRDRDPLDGNSGRRDDDQVRLAGNWDRNVRQWRPDWVEYDEYYRPVLSNPYRDPVRIVYVYQNAPRVVWIPPLARVVLEVAQYAAYSFTALVTNPINQVMNVAVGSFFGGGYYPGAGLPLPPPPPPLLNYANVPVQVRYSDATYEPFRVSKIVDVGDDSRYGERKVLLDGVTPAWGVWKQTPSGERSFEVHKTQQFPGLDDPQEAPLPGDYQMTLASGEAASGMNKRDVYLIAVAVACGALSIGAVVLSVFIGRRRRPSH
jgi:hypothetical protein